jgi:hypothetical protein
VFENNSKIVAVQYALLGAGCVGVKELKEGCCWIGGIDVKNALCLVGRCDDCELVK